LTGLEPIQRLRIILGEYANDLQRYPAELTSISDEALADISDAELNSWINILKQKISRHGKGPLRDLRSRLYLLRQKRSGDEHRKQKGLANDS
jgi:hypothetical protein